MIKSLWINLPVKDVNKSKAFFTEIGFRPNAGFGGNDISASFVIGDSNLILMLFEKSLYESFAGGPAVNPSTGNEVLFSFDAESEQEVDELAQKVVAAGGTIYGEPGYKDGWMYGCGFADLDGQRWNILYMDTTKIPLGDE
ncbi:VOC family protein [Pedobacter sp. AW1-32]|uniref:VOC family protein n=1 Tax=Pedobacter sp. AW1-32 TaxID=3383026 RepID=UPI003FEF5FD8